MVDVRSAEDDWLTPWVERWGDALTRFAYTYVEDRGVAEDLAQEAFIRLLQLHRGRPLQDPVPGWLFTVTYRLAIDHLRRRRLASRVPAEASASPDPDVEMRVVVRDLIDRLPARDRLCIWLFYYADMSVADIARSLGATPTEVKSRLHRARRRIATLWRIEDA
jgi:RNA polymerase sigma factor (sigma-70 family)